MQDEEFFEGKSEVYSDFFKNILRLSEFLILIQFKCTHEKLLSYVRT